MERAALLEEQLAVSGRHGHGVSAEPPRVRNEPAPVIEDPTLVRDEPTLIREEATLVREDTTLVRKDTRLVGEELSPDVPDFRQHPGRRAWVLTAIGVAVALVVGSFVSCLFARTVDPPRPTVAAPPPKEPAPPPPQDRRTPESAPSRTTPTDAESTPVAPELARVDASPDQGSSAVSVTIRVIPARAVMFRAGKKLGTGTVQVSVEPMAKQRLTALHNGYEPCNFTVDGSRNTVTVRLKRAAR
jgi:hypothetical protein